MIHNFFMEYKKGDSMQLKIIKDIIAYEANRLFADKVIEILVKRNPDYEKDVNAKCAISDFRCQWETSFEGKYHLMKLYESEWGEIPEQIIKQIKETSAVIANTTLISYGWIKEKETATV